MFKRNPPTTLQEVHERYHRFATAVIIALSIFFAVSIISYFQIKQQNNNIVTISSEQKIGRRIAIDFTCAGLKAVIKAGRNIVLGDNKISPLEAALLKDYNIPQDVVKDYRKASAVKYNNDIIDEIDKETDFAVRKRVLDKDGEIDCDKLQSVTLAK